MTTENQVRIRFNNEIVLDTGVPSSTNLKTIHYFEYQFIPSHTFVKLEVECVVRDIPLKLVVEWESDSTLRSVVPSSSLFYDVNSESTPLEFEIIPA